MSHGRYADPRALRFAIADRLRPLANERAVALDDLLRQFAYDRLLSRVFTSESERWVLKGATAMLARIGPEARHTLDVDLLHRDGGLNEAELALRRAAQVDLHDFFSFTLEPGQLLTEAGQVLRVPAQANLGVRRFAEFHVDLVAGLTMTGTPDAIRGIVPVDIPGLSRTSYIVYPIVDHIADKVCALHETHERASGLQDPSTRYRDLADLAVFAHTAAVDAKKLTLALDSEAARRRLALPQSVAIPTGANWRRGYARVARDVARLPERDLDAALDTVGRFIDPVLQGQAMGAWDHAALRWDRPQ
jgi:Nucleotidyl transferase AbiEii toxin, Type IV TA system